MRRVSDAWRRRDESVGLVPTMGALHEGHLSLIRRSRKRTDRTVVSIFVNPTQFAPDEDFKSYPRTWRADLSACRRAGVDCVFAPSVEAMYPHGFQTTVIVGSLASVWEGEIRPGHFDGVATVVLKLLTTVGPDVAYFGQKDYQQSVVIRRMVKDLNLPVRIEIGPIVRESGGVALSSRNAYLGAAAHEDARNIHRALRWAGKRVRNGAKTAGGLRRHMRQMVEENGLFTVDYIGFCDMETRAERKSMNRPLVILIAATCLEKGRAKNRRFIDNLIVR